MGNYSAYASYKDSGVEWLGEIPEHWEAKRFKFLLSESFKYGANEAAEIDDPDLPRYIRITDVKDDGTLRDDTFRSLPEEIAKDYLLEEGDILLARSGATVGKTFIYRKSWGKSAYAGYLIRARISQLNNSNFIYHFLQSSAYWDWVKSIFIQATIQNVSAEKYANFLLAIPPLDEQKAIAAFLDYKTQQIDQLIAKKEALLEKLDEKRTALISHAVTKGLDPTVPMKNSGVEWLGDTPEHWDVTRAKFVSTVFVPQRNKPDLNLDEGFPWLTMEDMLADRVSKTSFKVDEESMKKAGSKILKKGAVISSCIGNFEVCAINDVDVIINQQLQAFIPNNILPEYLREIVGISSDYFKMNATAATVVYVNQSGFANLPVLMPPISEQKSIVCKCEEIKKDNVFLKQKISNAIQLLKEYRTALITNAVTGKIDVRSVPIPTP